MTVPTTNCDGSGACGYCLQVRRACCDEVQSVEDEPKSTLHKVLTEFGYTKPYSHQVWRWIPVIEAAIEIEGKRVAKTGAVFSGKLIDRRIGDVRDDYP